MPRETFVNPYGLVTLPNQYGQYPAGAMKTAENVVIRAPGKLRQLHGPVAYANTTWPISGASRLNCMLSTGPRQVGVVVGGGSSQPPIWWFDPATAPGADPVAALAFDQQLASPFYNTFAAARTQGIFFRGRPLVMSNEGLLCVSDVVSPSISSEYTPRYAGFPQPLVVIGFPTDVAGGAIKDNTVVGYSALIRRKFDDGYEIVSPPALIQKIGNTGFGADCNVPIQVQWGHSVAAGRSGVRSGDTVEIYRTPAVAYATGGFVDGVADIEVGTTLYLVAKYTLTTTDISNSFATITDSAAPQALGEELYTNPYNQTLQSERRAPPHAKCVATYKGFALYGNIRVPAQALLRMPKGNGAVGYGGIAAPTDNQRDKGIGYRQAAATAASGSNTLTGISATDIRGIQVGQFIYGTFLATPGNKATVIAVGASTLQMSVTSSASGAVTAHIYDVLELDGIKYRFGDLQDLSWDMSLGGDVVGSPRLFYYVQSDRATVLHLRGALGMTATRVQMRSNSQRVIIEPYRYAQGNLSVRATHGADYDPPLPTFTTLAKTFTPTSYPNFIGWSWIQQPESMAPVNYAPVGEGEIDAITVAGEAAWVWTSKGLYRMTGDTFPRSSGIGANWRFDPVDQTIRLAGPMAWCVLGENTYAFTNKGFVEVSDANGGARELSTRVLGDQMPPLFWSETPDVFLAADELNQEIWISIYANAVTTTWLYSVRYGRFTKVTAFSSASFTFFDPGMHDMLVMDSPSGLAQVRRMDASAGAAMLQARAEFQPVFTQDPTLVKHFIEMMVIASAESAGHQLVARYNGVASGGGSNVDTLQLHDNDSRASFGVDKDAPAVGMSIGPGFTIAGGLTDPVEILGVSMRFNPLTEQKVMR